MSTTGAAMDELYGFGWDFRGKLEGLYNKITPADVARVGKKYLSGGYAVFVTTPAPELIDKHPKDAPATRP